MNNNAIKALFMRTYVSIKVSPLSKIFDFADNAMVLISI